MSTALKISVDVDELIRVSAGGPHLCLHVSSDDFKKLSGIRNPAGGDSFNIENLSFSLSPSITEELDKLLAQRVQPSLDDRIVMSREVFARYLEEMGNLTSARYPYREPDYKGVIIQTQDEVEGGVQLKCDYYIKGSL